MRHRYEVTVLTGRKVLNIHVIASYSGEAQDLALEELNLILPHCRAITVDPKPTYHGGQS